MPRRRGAPAGRAPLAGLPVANARDNAPARAMARNHPGREASISRDVADAGHLHDDNRRRLDGAAKVKF
jgi:hypothetical protein